MSRGASACFLCLCWISASLAMPGEAFSAGKKPPVGLSTQRQALKDGEAGYRNYVLYLPAQYNQGTRKKWPLILFLHGSEDRGNDPTLVEREGIPAVVARDPTFPFIVVSPQCPPDMKWSPPALMKLLTAVESKLRVDTSRIYLTGFSMGGYGTWSMAAAYPEVFAAIAPIAGGGDPKTVGRLKKTPVWAFHGARDENVPLTETTRMVNALKARGGRARLTVYPDLEHYIWSRTYGNGKLYAWFLSHRKV